MRRRLLIIGLAAALLTPLSSIAGPAPERIVSTQLCADQLLLLLAEREQLAALSYFAADPHFSQLAERASGLPRTRGVAEEVLPLDPDLVFAGAFSARPTVFLLRRLGRRVVELPVAESFEDIRRNISIVAAAVGAAARGDAMIAAFDAELARLPAAASAAPVAALYSSKGYMPASGSLAATAAQRAGFVDLATALGFAGATRVSLEMLLKSDPDLVVTADWGAMALADRHLRHPALTQAFGPTRTLAMPHRIWVCGAPFVTEAIERLIAWRSDGGGDGQ